MKITTACIPRIAFRNEVQKNHKKIIFPWLTEKDANSGA